MSKHPGRAAAKEAGSTRALPADPRYEIVFERTPVGPALVSQLVSVVTSAAQRIGAALGDGYARAAKLALSGVERLEDASAERRLNRRTNRHAARARAPGAASPPPTSIRPPGL
jgi:hypothetical protein